MQRVPVNLIKALTKHCSKKNQAKQTCPPLRRWLSSVILATGHN